MQNLTEAGAWLNPPVLCEITADGLDAEAAPGSDFWQETLYAFSRDSGHALLVDAPTSGGFEVTVNAEFNHLYDQAGIMLRTNERNWIKAGVEVSDGQLQLASVVTHEQSDWAMSPLAGMSKAGLVLRASWAAGAVTLRAKKEPDGTWETFRVAPFPHEVGLTKVGIFLCSPQRAGLRVQFINALFTAPDAALHIQPGNKNPK